MSSISNYICSCWEISLNKINTHIKLLKLWDDELHEKKYQESNIEALLYFDILYTFCEQFVTHSNELIIRLNITNVFQEKFVELLPPIDKINCIIPFTAN